MKVVERKKVPQGIPAVRVNSGQVVLYRDMYLIKGTSERWNNSRDCYDDKYICLEKGTEIWISRDDNVVIADCYLTVGVP
jgi:hypothetical protein